MTGYLRSNVSHRRGRSPGPGWAAFDRLYREEKGLESDPKSEPFPTLESSKPSATSGLAGYHRRSKSFSSLVQTTPEFTRQVNKHRNGVASNDSATVQADLPVSRLKNVHMWAEDDLILDVLAAANNDERQASDILTSMAPLCPNTDQRDPLEFPDFLNSMLSEKETGDTDVIAALVMEEPEFESSLLPKQPLSQLVEPEWEEVNDDYLHHRKDAIRMMRVASQHSKAAGGAYMRGDHTSARQLAAKAQSEWLAAEQLNAEASKEILRIRNSDNDMWRLDLHGLHASEAVHTLKQHLHKIESMQFCSGPSEGMSMSKGCTSNGDEKIIGYKQLELKRQRPSNLHVITGTGNHSRGQAALPTAIRTFLIDSEYRFEEARPGVLAVWAKFRRS